MTSFGGFIKSEREKRNWTQAEFGVRIGINTSAVSRIENGTQSFSKTKLKKVAELFEADLQSVTDMFFADKFAKEACKYKCSDSIFIVAEEMAKYLTFNSLKQGKLNFENEK